MLKWRCDKSNMAAAVPDVTKESSATGSSSITPTGADDNLSSVSSAKSAVDFQWSDEVEDPDTFNNEEKLPCVARIEQKDSGSERLLPGLKIYANQPLLLFRRVTKKRACARTIYHDKGGAYFEVGQTILIPNDYTGWFELVPPDFRRASCFRSIAEVAKVMPRKFFTRSNLKAVRIETGEDGEQKILERKVSAGCFLRTDSVMTAKWKTSAQTGVFRKKQTEWTTQEVQYLKCIDKDEKEILVPLTHRGKFNAIYEKGQLNQHSVYSMKDILDDLKLPIKIRLLFGKAPVVPCIFTGMLCVREAQDVDVILASTVLNRRNVLLEIPCSSATNANTRRSSSSRNADTNSSSSLISSPSSSSCVLRQATREEDFCGLASFEDAQKLCKKYAVMFSTLMKLSPELDTGQKTIQHVPTDPQLARDTDAALHALDLVTDISLTDEPRDLFMGESDTDTDSVQSDDQVVLPASGTVVELQLFSPDQKSFTHA